MGLTASSLRQNIYKILDRVLETGIPVEIERKGKKLKIISISETDKLKNLKKRDVFNCEPDELVHIDWSDEWNI